jgi:hypothetical protein
VKELSRIHRQGAKDAKNFAKQNSFQESRNFQFSSKDRSVLLRQNFFAAWKEIFVEISWGRTPLACMSWPLDS